MKKRTPEDFRNQVIKLNLARWNIHDCSICGYECGYIFVKDGEVYYDAGCFCVSMMDRPRKSSWEEVAGYYNTQIDWLDNPENKNKKLTKEAIKKMDDFWGFDK